MNALRAGSTLLLIAAWSAWLVYSGIQFLRMQERLNSVVPKKEQRRLGIQFNIEHIIFLRKYVRTFPDFSRSKLCLWFLLALATAGSTWTWALLHAD